MRFPALELDFSLPAWSSLHRLHPPMAAFAEQIRRVVRIFLGMTAPLPFRFAGTDPR
jgi:hypothetical protein